MNGRPPRRPPGFPPLSSFKFCTWRFPDINHASLLSIPAHHFSSDLLKFHLFKGIIHYQDRASLAAQTVKESSRNMRDLNLDPWIKGLATHCSILAWRIPWTEEPDELQSMGSQRVRHDWVTNAFTLSSWKIRLYMFEISQNGTPAFLFCWPAF